MRWRALFRLQVPFITLFMTDPLSLDCQLGFSKPPPQLLSLDGAVLGLVGFLQCVLGDEGVVESWLPPKAPPLPLGTWLVYNDSKLLGQVIEIFGTPEDVCLTVRLTKSAFEELSRLRISQIERARIQIHYILKLGDSSLDIGSTQLCVEEESSIGPP